MANLVVPPYDIYADANGDPLEDGYIYIGEPGLSPITNPLQAYWDSDLSVPASNIRTSGGYPSNSGTPGRLYTSTNYSIIVQDKNQRTVYTQLDSVDYINSASGSLISLVDTIADLRGLALASQDDQASVGGSVTVGDGLMGPLYYWSSTSAATDNGVSIIKPTSTVGNGRWLWINTNAPMETVDITVTGTLVLDFKNRIFLVNNPLAAVLAVPDGDFQGQDIQIANRGVTTVEITGTGISANTFVTESVTLKWLGTQWDLSSMGSNLISAATATRGYSAITISEYDTSSSPIVKAGSVFENNGVVITIGSDLAPINYAGVTVSTEFYLYYDESGGGFLYDETAPVWSDTLQGYYNGTDRALFSMFKDAGGTLYQYKAILRNISFLHFANTIKHKKYENVTSTTDGVVFDLLKTWVPTTGGFLHCDGQFNKSGTTKGTITQIERVSATQINLKYIISTAVTAAETSLVDGQANAFSSIEIMSNFDELT